MTLLTISPGASNHDAWQGASGAMTLTGEVRTSTGVSWAGLLLPGVAVPAGATITNATLYYKASAGSHDDPDLTWYGEAADNAAVFGGAANNISGRSRTTATVADSATNIGITNYRTVTITSLIAEIVGRAGWVSGNNAALLGDATTSSDLWIRSYDNGGDVWYVEINYAGGAQSVSPAGKAVGIGIGGATMWNHRIVAAVGAGNDDGRENNAGAVLLTLGYLFVNSANPVIGYIVRGLAMPSTNVTVVEAHSRLYARDTNYDSPGVTVRGQGSPADFAETTNNLSGRTKTANGVTWSASNIGLGWRDSPDIRSVIQEIVGGAGWAGGNHDIAIFLIDNGTGGALDAESFETAGSNQPQLVIDWRFGGIAPDGKAVGVGFGSATVGRGAVSVAPAGKAVTVGKGAATVGRGAVSVAPAGKAVAVGKGAATVGRGAVSVAPAGKAVAVGKGSATVGRGTVSVTPAGKAVAVGKGTPALGLRVAPAGRAVGLALGGATVGRGAVSVAPAGKAVAVGKGAPTVTVGAQTIAPAGKSVGVGKGSPAVGRGAVNVAPAGKAVAIGKGTPSVSVAAQTVAPAGKAVGVGKGSPTVGRGAVSVAPVGKNVGVGKGSPTVARVALQIAPAGRAVDIGKGTPTVAVQGPQEIAPAGRAVGIGKGTPGVVARGIGVNAVTVAGYSEPAGSWSFNHAGGGVHRLAAVIVHGMRTTAGPINLSASYGGAAMAPAVVQQYADEPRTRAYVVAIFTLANPPTGSQGVEVTSAQNLTAVVAAAVTLANVSPTSPLGGSSGGNVIGSTHCSPPALEALAGSWLLGAATMRGGDLNFTPGAGVVEVYDVASGASNTADLTATAGYRPLAAAGAAGWAATTNALDYGVAAMVEVRPAMVATVPGLAVPVAGGAAAMRNLADVRPAGRAVGLVIGAPVVARPGALVAPAGLAVGVGLGAAAVEIGGVVVGPAGLAVAAALGAPALGQVVAPAGLAVATVLGAVVLPGGVATVAPAGLAVVADGGAARLWSHRLVVAVVEDGYETPAGAVNLQTTSLNVEAGQPWAAMASGPLDAPNAATVVGLRIEMQTIGYDDPALEAGCELSAAPAALATTANNISARTLAGARALWQATNVGQVVTTPNLSAPAQAVLNLPEWAPGSRLLVVLRDLGAGGWLRWYSADAGAQYRPRMILEWQFGAADLELAPAGLAVGAAAGEAVMGVGTVGIAAAGRAVAVAAGAAVVGRGAVGVVVVGLAAGAGAGEPAVSGGLLVIEPEGLAVGAAAGEAFVGWAIRPAGLGVTVVAGAAVVGRGGKAIGPAGRAVGVAIGAVAVGRGGKAIAPAGVVVGVAIGAVAVGRGGLVIAPAGRAVAVAQGAPAAGVVVRSAGVAVVVAQGAPAVGRGAATVAPAGRAVAVAAGTAAVGRGGLVVAPAGRAVAVAAGGTTVARRLEFVRPGGLALGAVIGLVMVALARQPWRLTLRPRGNELTVDERGNGLTLAGRGNELSVEER